MTAITASPEGGKKDPEYNIYRDSLLRYLGYANEVGESFRYQFPRFVAPSYAVAFGYCLADAVTSGQKTYKAAEQAKKSTAAIDSFVSTTDTLLWQSLASVFIPGLVINRIVKVSRFAVARSPAGVPAMITKWLPTAMGLGSIPLIIHPIDGFVDFLMDNSYRQIQWSSYFS